MSKSFGVCLFQKLLVAQKYQNFRRFFLSHSAEKHRMGTLMCLKNVAPDSLR